MKARSKVKSQSKSLFRGDYGMIYDLGSHGSMPVSMLLRLASKAIHKSLAKTKYDLIVLANPNHKSNGHKSCNVARRAGWIRLAPCKAA